MTEVTTVEVVAPALRDQLAKLVLGTVAGFVAGKLTEIAYDAVMAKRRQTA